MSIDSKLYRILNKIGQCVLLSILWVLLSMPVITAGGAMSAAYYCAEKNIRRDEGSMLSSFWRSFRENLLQGTLALLIFVGLGLALWAIGIVLVSYLSVKRETATFLFLLLAVFIVAWMLFCFASIARFRTDLGSILGNSFQLFLLNIPRGLALVMVLAAVLTGFILTLPRSTGAILFLPGLYALLCSFMIEPVFKKFIDKDSADTQNEN